MKRRLEVAGEYPRPHSKPALAGSTSLHLGWDARWRVTLEEDSKRRMAANLSLLSPVFFAVHLSRLLFLVFSSRFFVVTGRRLVRRVWGIDFNLFRQRCAPPRRARRIRTRGVWKISQARLFRGREILNTNGSKRCRGALWNVGAGDFSGWLCVEPRGRLRHSKCLTPGCSCSWRTYWSMTPVTHNE